MQAPKVSTPIICTEWDMSADGRCPHREILCPSQGLPTFNPKSSQALQEGSGPIQNTSVFPLPPGPPKMKASPLEQRSIQRHSEALWIS